MRDESVEEIQRVTAKYFGISHESLLGRTRLKTPTLARHLAMYLSKERLGRSFPELGREFGMRDHTTCMSGVRKIEKLLLSDERIQIAVAAVTKRLGSLEMLPVSRRSQIEGLDFRGLKES